MTPTVRLAQVSRRFGKTAALDGLDLEVEPGQIYGFLGRNGAGKTTTLRILMGLLRADAGEVSLFGQSVRRVTVAMKRRIGHVSQEQNFYPWMTAKQLGHFVAGFYPTWDAPEFERLLAVLDVPSTRRAAELSGGTRAKLALALAFAPHPALVLLDEPTAGLDPVARREFNDLLADRVRAEGTTVLFSSHLVAEVEHVASHVGVIQAGRMRFQGALGTLTSSVRQVCSAAPLGLPAGFEIVRGDVWRAPAELWLSTAWPPGVQVSALGLEDIFLAFARTDSRGPPP